MFNKIKSAFSTVAEKISKKELSEKDLENPLWDFQLELIQSDVAYDAAAKIAEYIKSKLLGVKVSRFENLKKVIKSVLEESVVAILKDIPQIDVLKLIRETKEKPFVILFVGINGTGKTTTIAKFAKLLLENKFTVVLAASDTFRAGSIEQLKKHGENIGVRVISHSYGADAAAVAYDTVAHARAKGIDVVLVDTAGRMQTNKNLMDEVSKIKRVIKPHLTILTIDSLAGNDAVEQAEEFDKVLSIDAIILTKADADTKGGTALSVMYAIKKPIIYIGTGQSYADLKPFSLDEYLRIIFR